MKQFLLTALIASLFIFTLSTATQIPTLAQDNTDTTSSAVDTTSSDVTATSSDIVVESSTVIVESSTTAQSSSPAILGGGVIVIGPGFTTVPSPLTSQIFISPTTPSNAVMISSSSISSQYTSAQKQTVRDILDSPMPSFGKGAGTVRTGGY
jgi:hypothetical protein